MPIKPSPIKKGDTIGVIALSAPTEEVRFAAARRQLEKLGYKVKVALTPWAQYGKSDFLFSSDSAANRAQALHGLLADKEVSVILAVRGAYGSMEVLPLLDFDLLRTNPKIVCGFSDTTAVINQCYGRAGVVALHGPSLESAFGKMEADADAGRSAQTLLDMLAGKVQNPFVGCTVQLLCGSGTAEGAIVGGNLSMLAALAGTPWDVDWSGHILCLEEVGERPYRVHRMLLQLKAAGKLAKLAAVVLGSFRDCVHPQQAGPTLAQVFEDIFAEYGYPLIAGLPFGHERLNLPLPIGVRARVSANKLEFMESIVAL